jgi:hypothetical protein
MSIALQPLHAVPKREQLRDGERLLSPSLRIAFLISKADNYFWLIFKVFIDPGVK